MTLANDTYLDALEREGRALRDAAATDLGAAIVHCPGWTTTDLLGHVGTVYRWFTTIVETRTQEPVLPDRSTPAPSGPEVVDWFDEVHGRLVATLRAVDPATPIWTWAERREAGFFPRRATHETLVHRWDAQLATGGAQPLDPDLAADGIDEICEVGLRYSLSKPERTYPAGSLHLHRTDGPGEWMLQWRDGRLDVSHEHGKGDAALRGPAEGLLLFLWGRGREGLELFGDAAVADAWAAVAP